MNQDWRKILGDDALSPHHAVRGHIARSEAGMLHSVDPLSSWWLYQNTPKEIVRLVIDFKGVNVELQP